MINLLKVVVACMLGWALLTPAFASDKQRAQFVAAEKALTNGDIKKFNTLSKQLQSYVLYPYLQYDYLTKNIATVSQEQVQQFLNNNANTPLAQRLRYIWLKQLAQKKQWPVFLASYQTNKNHSTAMRCYYMQALLATGQKAKAYQILPQIWLSQNSQPKSCDSVFNQWLEDKQLSRSLLWQRYKLAVVAGNETLIDYLFSYMPESNRPYAQLWRAVAIQPALVTKAKLINTDHPQISELLLFGIDRMAQQQPSQAIRAWKLLKKQYNFSKTQRQLMDRRIAISIALDAHPEAAARLELIPPQLVNQLVMELRIRTAIAQQDWADVEQSIKQLPFAKQQQAQWRYWMARSLMAQDKSQQANDIYNKLANSRSFYGMLASMQLGQPYIIDGRKVTISKAALDKVAKIPGIERAYELFKLKRYPDARREWVYAIKSMSEQQRMATAALAQQWQWHDRAIFTSVNTKQRHDLQLRFPLGFDEDVQQYAKKLQLNPAMLYAMIRQESAFMSDAASSAGAVGLMQLMPPTAQDMAKRHNITYKGRNNLIGSDININLGSLYYKYLLQRFDNQPAVAVAAYNAGPGNVSDWLPETEAMPLDIWIDTLPYKETRNYIKNVLLYAMIYEQQLGQPSANGTRLKPVMGKG